MQFGQVTQCSPTTRSPGSAALMDPCVLGCPNFVVWVVSCGFCQADTQLGAHAASHLLPRLQSGGPRRAQPLALSISERP